MIPKEYYEELSCKIKFRDGLPYWIIKPARNVDVKKPAGCLSSDGYRHISITINNKRKKILAHRLHWYQVYGELPRMLDHINRNRDDNCIENLREANNSQNSRNRESWGSSKFVGVNWDKKRCKWKVQCRFNDKKNFLGYFDCETKAAKVYDQFCIDNNLKFANLNFSQGAK